DLLTMGIATEEIARGDFGATYGIQLAGLAGEIIGKNGGDEVKRRWLPPTVRGETIVSIALTEPTVGSDAANLACRAVRQGDYNRVIIALAALGAAQVSLEETMAYAKERKAFGRPLAQYEGVSFPIAEAATHIDAARLLCHRALWLADHGQPYTKEAAMVKWWGPRLAVE